MPSSIKNIQDTPLPDQSARHLEIIELFFFAYRDFVSDADMVLGSYGFGRAHHRALYFITRRPGLTVASLLDILKITKQSLARVLKQLVDEGFVEQREGIRDRRLRQLYPTLKGRELVIELSTRQSERIDRAFGNMDLKERKAVEHFLKAMTI